MCTCTNCNVPAYTSRDREKSPANCPMHQEKLMQEALETYQEPGDREFYIKASCIEGEGYDQWPKLRETVEVCRKMGYHRINLVFCKGLREEARVVVDLLWEQGFDVVSVICKAGGFEKELLGIPREGKTHSEQLEPICNPVIRTRLLNPQKTEFNIALGLCVGCDSMFYKYSETLVTTLVTKDRVLVYSPCGTIYCVDGYFKQRLRGQRRNDNRTAWD